VGEALDNVIERYPGMRARLRAAGGELRSSVLFFLNSEDIRARDGEATPVAAGDELAIVPIVEGG
jgi:molybdopterin converting factor small subunit